MTLHEVAFPESDNPGPVVTVICDNPSHPSKVARCAFFYRSAVNGDRWNLFPTRTQGKGQVDPFFGRQVIDAEGALVPQDEWGIRAGSARFEVVCRLCKQRVVARQETIQRAFDKLAVTAPAWELNLPALRAKLM